MVGQGCPDQNKIIIKLAHCDVFSLYIPNINSHVSILSVVRDLSYPLILAVKVHLGRGLRKISGAKKHSDLCPKCGFFGYCETIVVVPVTSKVNSLPKN